MLKMPDVGFMRWKLEHSEIDMRDRSVDVGLAHSSHIPWSTAHRIPATAWLPRDMSDRGCRKFAQQSEEIRRVLHKTKESRRETLRHLPLAHPLQHINDLEEWP